jgi:hypothetical protein
MCVAVSGSWVEISASPLITHYTFLYDRIWSFSVSTPSEVFVNLTRSRIFEKIIFAHMILFNFLKREGSFLYSKSAHTHIYVRYTLILSFHLCLTPRCPKSCVTYRSSHRNFVCIYFSRGCYIKHAHRVEEGNSDRRTKWRKYQY